MRAALVSAGLVVAMLAAWAPGAQALEAHHYAGVVLNPGQRYEGGNFDWGFLVGNLASYEGSGELHVCEAAYSQNRQQWQRTCGVNVAGGPTSHLSWAGDYMIPYVENAGSYAHTIQGWGYTVFNTLTAATGVVLEKLQAGQGLESLNLKYSFLMQSDGNAVVYNNQTGKACWNSGTYGHPGAYAIMQSDGNFVVYGPGGSPALFNTHTNGNSWARMEMQNDGNLVIYAYGTQTPLWASSWVTGQVGC